jgi:hypothetical protein
MADFRNQRTRWINAQIKYLLTHFSNGFTQLIKGNMAYADKVFQFMLPPRVIMLGILSILVLVSACLQHVVLLVISFDVFVFLVATLYISAPKELMKKISWKEVANLPLLFFNLFCLLHKSVKLDTHSFTLRMENLSRDNQ